MRKLVRAEPCRQVLRETVAGIKSLAFEHSGAEQQLQGQLYVLTQLTAVPKLRRCLVRAEYCLVCSTAW